MAVFPVGSSVRVVNDDHGSVFSIGDVLTISHAQDGEGRWDTVRASRDSDSESGYVYVGGLAAVVPTGAVVGGRVKIRTSGANGASVAAGDLGTIVEVADDSWGGDAFYVKMDIEQGTRACYRDKSGADYIFTPRDVEFLTAAEAPEVTLDSFRLSFLTGAVERGERNGGRHPQQVKEALDEFARAEFLDPSKTLEQFQQRVVDHAMSAKGRYSWCGEPEAYLTEIGLAHLLPVKRTVRVTIDVEVTGEDTWRPSQWRAAARQAAAAQNDEGMFSASIL